MKNLRFALRMLARSRASTLVIVLSLGLGIGANTAIFSLLHQVLLRSLPVERPEQLVLLESPADFKGGRSSTNNAGSMESIFSYRMFRGLEQRARGVAGVAAFRMLGANLAFQNQTIDGHVVSVSGRYFSLLGVRPLLGRTIEPDDDATGAGRPVAVLSHAYWQNRLGGRAEVLNQPLRVNGQIMTIVGVAPYGFSGTTFGDQPDVFVPLALTPRLTPGWDGTQRWDDYWLYLFARLQPGTTPARAEAALNSVYRGLVEEQAAALPEHWRVAGERDRFLKSTLTLVEGRMGQSAIRDRVRTPILILMVSTALVLLIAIANTANVLLARAAERRRELAIRTAMGASRMQLVRQVLTEALLIAGAGAAAGLLFAFWTVRFLLMSLGERAVTSGGLSAAPEWPMFVFALGLSLASGVLCGLYPAWQAARGSVSGALKDQSGRSSGNLGAARLRKVLVAAQVVVSAALLVPTGLFLRSLSNLTHLDLGMNTTSVVTFTVSPELNGYKPPAVRALYSRAEQELAAIPGVANVTTAMVPLIGGNHWGNTLIVEGYSRDPRADTNSMLNVVGTGFFGKFGIPLLNGREFTERDTVGAPKVAVVNERFARYFFGNGNPIGRRFGAGNPKAPLDIEIVGVVKDSHYADVKTDPPRVYYLPWRQDEEAASITFYVRTALPPERVVPELRRVMRRLDPDLPLADLRTLDDRIQWTLRSDQVVVQLSAAFAIVATLLAMLGLYGVMAYSVTRRTREIGIRLALGAPVTNIRAMVFRELGWILAAGLVLGIPAALGLARLAESQLFGVKSFDLPVVAAAAVALTVAAVLAGYVPARRATRVDPVSALRHE